MTIISVQAKQQDTRAQVRKSQLHNSGWTAVRDIHITDLFAITKKITAKQTTAVANLIHNPISQLVSVREQQSPTVFDWAIEVGYLPGVTDNVANTVKEEIEMLLGIKFSDTETVQTSQVTFLSGKLSREEVGAISDTLANPLIQAITIKSKTEWQKDKGFQRAAMPSRSAKVPKPLLINLDIPDEELAILGKQGIADPKGFRRGPLSLSVTQLLAIREYFKKEKRQPTDIELESIAQNWSEHCRHTIFASPIDEIEDGLFEHYIQGATEKIRAAKGDADTCVSVFSDNAGAIIFDDEYLVCDKVETHNSPSALDPFGGAITGIVGVNRDIIGFGLGAKPIANRYGFCLPDPRDTTELYRDPNQKQSVLPPQKIIDGVIEGIASGGNQSGIPSPQGFLFYDKRFRAKPLVFAGSIGLIPRQTNGKDTTVKQANPGDLIVMVGGRVGLDGIHGATFSSEGIGANSPTSAVQIGDPITQKKLSDTIVKEARDLELFTSITDNGAGGLSCSVSEMAREAGGCEVDLNKVPLKYAGLEPWQTWVSESQERMTLSVPANKWPKLKKLLISRGVEGTVIGTFTKSGRCIVNWNDNSIVDINLRFMHKGWPKLDLKTKVPQRSKPKIWKTQSYNWSKVLHEMLQRHNLRSFAEVSSHYDSEVQGGSTLKPLQGKGQVNADTTAVKPVLDSDKAVVMSHALYPTYTEHDPYAMAVAAVDTAVRNLVAAGASVNEIALLDNFCWCSSNDPERLYQLKEAVRGCHDAAIAYQAPFISGKDSMFNDFSGFDDKGQPIKISALPTLLISSLAVVEDSERLVSLDFQQPGEFIFVLGETHNEFGGSEYHTYQSEKGLVGDSPVPKVSLKANKKLYEKYGEAVSEGLVTAAQSIGRGGLLYALSKMAMGGKLGLTVNINDIPGTAKTDEAKLFSESQGRILVSVQPQHLTAFRKLFSSIPHELVGSVQPQNFTVYGKGEQPLVATTVDELHDSYTAHLKPTTVAMSRKSSTTPLALVLAGYGINCEEETAFAFNKAGAKTTIIHIDDLIASPKMLERADILAVPGGFSYGDDTGSGLAFANKMRLGLWKEIEKFYQRNTLAIGICNGFQVLTNLGLLPGIDNKIGSIDVALSHNDNAQYTVRWVDIVATNTSPWLQGIHQLTLPIAHGEGKIVCSPETLTKLQSGQHVAARYTHGEIADIYDLPINPNGSLFDIAALTDTTGRVLGLMPHPERAMFFSQLPHKKMKRRLLEEQGQMVPETGPGFQVFKNAVAYFSR